MALNTVAAMLAAMAVMLASAAESQSVSAELAMTGGYSSAGIGVAATQGRVFGEAGLGVRFNLEGAWANRSEDGTDAFGAAYPYDNRVHLIEAYGDRMFRPGAALVAIRAGRFRTPFGIYSGGEHGYSGFLRAPLIRYGGYFALSNTFLENGVSMVAGVPNLYVETSVGAPGDVGAAVRPSGLDRVVRLQAAYRSFIVGLSHILTRPYQSPRFAQGRAAFTGIDGRWMHSGVELRGEWITGQPFDGTHTSGGYLDLLVHRPVMGAVTAVVRAERLGYDAVAPFALYVYRYTAGGRVRLFNKLSVQTNVIWQNDVPQQEHAAVDVALTYVMRLDSRRTR